MLQQRCCSRLAISANRVVWAYKKWECEGEKERKGSRIPRIRRDGRRHDDTLNHFSITPPRFRYQLPALAANQGDEAHTDPSPRSLDED